jgi:hypothetical protein
VNLSGDLRGTAIETVAYAEGECEEIVGQSSDDELCGEMTRLGWELRRHRTDPDRMEWVWCGRRPDGYRGGQ